MAANEAERKKVLVTGGTGLVGRGVQYVIENDPNNTDEYIFLSSKDGDLRILSDCERVFEEHKPTHVLHLAAFVGGLFRNMKFPVDFWHSNVDMNNNIMKCSFKYEVKKLVSCLSTCIFPDKTTYPIDETMIHDGPPHTSNEPYAYAKRMIDVQNRAYKQQHGCNFTSVIPTNIFGPHDNFHLKDSHVIPALIHKSYLAKKNSTPFTCFGSGTPLRQFIYSRDLAKLMVWVINNYDDVAPLILSVDESDEISIKQVAETICEAMRYTEAIQWDTTKADGQFKKTASNQKLRELVPDFEFTPFDVAMTETVEWFNQNYETCRK